MKIICEDGTEYDAPNSTTWTPRRSGFSESPAVPFDVGKTIRYVVFTEAEVEVMSNLLEGR